MCGDCLPRHSLDDRRCGRDAKALGVRHEPRSALRTTWPHGTQVSNGRIAPSGLNRLLSTFPALTKTMSTAETPTLRAESVFRSFTMGRTVLEVLQGISLEVRPGEKLFLCGPSGAGKTTLLYTLAGLEKPDSGDVFIDNQSLYRSSRSQRAITRNRCMGYVFQNYYLLPDLTALENVLLPSMIRGRGVRNRALELLDKVGLSERTDHLPAEMSGGEQQRTAIARALMNDPPIIFADEPTGNLDSRTRNEVMDMLLSIVDEASKTLIVVTHDRKLAALGDRCIQIKDGQINSSELSPVIAQS